MTNLKDLGEFGLIERLTRVLPGANPAIVEGIGDDCAVIRTGDTLLLLSCDASIEDIHFDGAYYQPRDIGWKAAASALSDIAAMGGVARYALVTLACPTDKPLDFVEALYQGLADAIMQSGAVIIGGDTTRSPDRIMLDVTVIGEVPDNRYLPRHGVRSGDVLVLTGMPGQSAGGLCALQKGLSIPTLTRAHLQPLPRLKEGQWLAAHPEVHAMIDCSDGLLQDVEHLALASQCGIDIDPELLPISPELLSHEDALQKDSRDLVLHGGEDYELIFSVAPDQVNALRDEFGTCFDLPITEIGICSEDWQGIRIGGEIPSATSGFDHFS
jgi:thiamine-monophosphate kinase